MTNKILDQSLRVALAHLPNHSEYQHYPHFTFIIQRGTIIEWGTNRAGAPTKVGYHLTAKIHAEMDAYRRARGLLDSRRGWEAINIRLSRKGQPKMAAPCPVCAGWLEQLGCVCVWHTNSLGLWTPQFLDSNP